jgi:hypothetical protein
MQTTVTPATTRGLPIRNENDLEAKGREDLVEEDVIINTD